ncbi:hypothetical protein K227x_17180 [Rubripirellula lacrimiformis]|uniref:Uncharacterized protein n=1 Tax=Rubripirellula lacrimiformis TaxID=1930273 RepID=A0A517N864_9BACT|nr:hypothetical protein K227x_17180 [Rubripirellula lacrimiformis]
MIELQRTSRDAWWFVLPILSFFVAAFTYISAAVHGLGPVVGRVYSDASWVAPPICVVLWCMLVWYVYRLVAYRRGVLPRCLRDLLERINQPDLEVCSRRQCRRIFRGCGENVG